MANTNDTPTRPSTWLTEPSLSMRPDLASYELEDRISQLLSIPPGKHGGTDPQPLRDLIERITPSASTGPAMIVILTDGDPLDIDQAPAAP